MRPPPNPPPLAPHLDAVLEALDALLLQLGHDQGCGCTLCVRLSRALREYEALTGLAYVVQAEAAHEAQHPPEQGLGWQPIWRAYEDATR